MLYCKTSHFKVYDYLNWLCPTIVGGIGVFTRGKTNVERGLYVKIIHVNYDIVTKGSHQNPTDNVKRQIDVIGGWVGLTMTLLTLS